MLGIKLSSRDAIIEAAFQVFNRQPTATLADVAVHAGVGRATLHRHFTSRANLMVALAHVAMEELSQAVEASTAIATSHGHGLRLALEAVIPLAERQGFLAQEPVDQDPTIAEALARQKAETCQTIDAAKVEGVFAKAVPTAWIAEAYDALIYAAWATVRSGEATPRQAADLAWHTLTNGLNEAPK